MDDYDRYMEGQPHKDEPGMREAIMRTIGYQQFVLSLRVNDLMESMVPKWLKRLVK